MFSSNLYSNDTKKKTAQDSVIAVSEPSYSRFFFYCTKRNLYVSAPKRRSKMRIAPLDRAQKNLSSLMLFLIFCCKIEFFYHSITPPAKTSSVLRGESDSQFLGVGDFKVFAGLWKTFILQHNIRKKT